MRPWGQCSREASSGPWVGCGRAECREQKARKAAFSEAGAAVGVASTPCSSHQLVQRINSIYSAKRGKKRLKKLSMSSIETASLRGGPGWLGPGAGGRDQPQAVLLRPRKWPRCGQGGSGGEGPGTG